MRFAMKNLSVLAYANGFTLWHYKADGSRTGIVVPGFFDAASDMLAGGDMLLASGADGGGLYCLAANDREITLVPMAG